MTVVRRDMTRDPGGTLTLFLDGDPAAAAINHETQRERVETFATLKPRERPRGAPAAAAVVDAAARRRVA
jgi:hypothetical protein